MTDMTAIITCDKCGLSYRASLIPHECADWTKGSNKYKGDVMERREEWSVEKGTHYWNVLNENGSEIVSGVHGHIAQEILNNHNQHTTLVEQRDLLVVALTKVRTWLVSPATDAITILEMREMVNNALATVEQGGES